MPERPAIEASSVLKQAGARIRALRTAVDLNQDDFADAVGLHRSYVGQLENGHKDVRLTTLERVAGTYGLTIWQLLDPGYDLALVALEKRVSRT